MRSVWLEVQAINSDQLCNVHAYKSSVYGSLHTFLDPLMTTDLSGWKSKPLTETSWACQQELSTQCGSLNSFLLYYLKCQQELSVQCGSLNSFLGWKSKRLTSTTGIAFYRGEFSISIFAILSCSGERGSDIRARILRKGRFNRPNSKERVKR